jgi:DNA-binding transcriptional ArsR family regulator
MLSVPFTAEDLLQTKFAAEPAPMMELVLATAVLQRHDALFERWRRKARISLPRAAGPLLELIPDSARGPLFLDPIGDNIEEGLDTVMSTPQPTVDREMVRIVSAGRISPFVRALHSRDREAWAGLAKGILAAHRALLADPWPRVQAGYHAEIGLRAATFARQGMRAALTSVYPGTAWDGSTLQIPAEIDRRFDPAGHGVTLMPSVMWRGRPMFKYLPAGSLLMLYSAATPLPLLTSDPGNGSLAGLLGTTRAAILGLAAAAPTTTELARQAEVSISSASAHAKVLRQSGLISTTRDGKAVRHTLTRLGEQLLARGPTMQAPLSPPEIR